MLIIEFESSGKVLDTVHKRVEVIILNDCLQNRSGGWYRD
jgi:hypothetical protein